MSAVAATEACLDRIHRLDGRLRAFITVTAEEALRQARAADEASGEGRWLGLLHGMPVAVKDNIDTEGVRTTAGAAFMSDRVANADAEVVRRMKAAGAVIVGKLNMAELAFGIRSFSLPGGQCRNPWNPERIPGGSSGGSGAAVAAGMCTGALGTDTGGSIRLPAAFNGVAGLRPTSGRVSNRGAFPVSAMHDTIGPLACRVEDVARLFAVLAGYDPEDPCSEDRPLPNFLPTLGDGVAGLRIGIPRNHYFDGTAAEVAEAVMAAARALERQGAVLVEVDVPGAERAQEMATVLIFSDACAVHGDRLRREPGAFSEQVHARMSRGLAFTGSDYAEAMRFKMQWKRSLKHLFDEVDLLLSPTAPDGAPPIEDGKSLFDATMDMTRNTYGGALAHIPGLSVPCGFTRAGLPIGMQLEAAWWEEPLLLRAGCSYQRITDHHRREPPLVGTG